MILRQNLLLQTLEAILLFLQAFLCPFRFIRQELYLLPRLIVLSEILEFLFLDQAIVNSKEAIDITVLTQDHFMQNQCNIPIVSIVKFYKVIYFFLRIFVFRLEFLNVFPFHLFVQTSKKIISSFKIIHITIFYYPF